jgi:uncharacterized damage-inducible protein DinB
MMNLIDPVLSELSHEAATTRRLLDRVPQPHLAWKPHEKSMTLGRLATHIAEIPGWVSGIVDKDELDIGASGYTPPKIESVAEVLATFDRNIAAATDTLKRQSNDRLLANWRFKKNGQLMLEMPRLGMIRSFLMNHLIHHRGQLSVYLRLQNVPVPSIYGPTADEPM